MNKNTNDGFEIKKGRSNNDQYINTKFNLIDAINEYADCETLGFYIGLKSYINREDNTKDNQITYSQKYLSKKLGVSTNYKYYKHLKLIFDAGLIDIEKTAIIKFFINYNIEGKNNPLVSKEIAYFSTLDNINIPLKNNLEKLINELYPEIPLEFINVVSVSFKNSYIIHDYPPYINLDDESFMLMAYRSWDKEMERFKNKAEYTYKTEKKSTVKSEESDSDNQNKGEGDNEGGDSNNQKEGVSDNQKEPDSNNQNHNIINILNNNIIKSSNSIINQSIMDMDEKGEKDKNNEFDKKDGLIDLDKQIQAKGFISYKDLIYDLGLNDKKYYNYPYDDWIEAVKKAIYEMYYFDDTRIRGRNVSRFDAISKLQNIKYDIVISTIDKVIESSMEQEIKYPSAFIKSTLYNEISEYSAKIQAMVNYNS
ncbi:hypothetical protein ACF3M2_14185 [Tissierella carlieri]|uniref:hypothetical protein n=1 Tax=Tissierella carlieri TaxID=689904 RepID=UPI0038682374